MQHNDPLLLLLLIFLGQYGEPVANTGQRSLGIEYAIISDGYDTDRPVIAVNGINKFDCLGFVDQRQGHNTPSYSIRHALPAGADL